MTKAELVELIADKTGVSKKDTGIVVNMILSNIGQALVEGDKVELRARLVQGQEPSLTRRPQSSNRGVGHGAGQTGSVLQILE